MCNLDLHEGEYLWRINNSFVLEGTRESKIGYIIIDSLIINIHWNQKYVLQSC